MEECWNESEGEFCAKSAERAEGEAAVRAEDARAEVDDGAAKVLAMRCKLQGVWAWCNA